MDFGLVLKKAVENVLKRVHQPSLIELRHGKRVRGFEGSSYKSIRIYDPHTAAGSSIRGEGCQLECL